MLIDNIMLSKYLSNRALKLLSNAASSERGMLPPPNEVLHNVIVACHL